MSTKQHTSGPDELDILKKELFIVNNFYIAHCRNVPDLNVPGKTRETKHI